MKILQNKLIKSIKTCLIIFSFAFCIAAQNSLVRFEKSIEAGQTAEVEKDLFNYVIANPKDAKGFALLAKMRLKQNRLNEAKSLVNKALTIDPKSLSAKLTLAATYYQLGEIEQSRAILDGISVNEISDDSIRLNIAQTYAQIGDCVKALILAEKMTAKIKNGDALPFRAACYLESSDKKNFASLIPSAKLSAKQNPAIAVKFAEVLSKAAMHKETADLLRLVIVSTPKNTDALLLLAKSEIYLKDFANAKIHLAQAEKIEPNSGKMLFVKSFLESEQGNSAQSLELLEKSLAENPNNTEVLAQFILTAMRANQSGKAVRAAQSLLNLQPENPEYLYLFGAASLQNNNLQTAESSLKKFLEARPNDSRGCVALGLTFAAQPEKLAEARSQMQHCIEINPNNYEATYQLGLSYKTAGETPKAVEYLEQTVKLAPDNASALRDLGAVYLQSGAEAQARTVLEKAVALNPNDADTHFQLSRLYNLTGERELAKKHLEIFQKLKNPKKEGM
jgi:tetratricopeptide (TPR) repeat protein